MSLVLKSLDTVTTTTVGDVISFDVPRIVSMAVLVTGSPGACQCTLEGALDGSTFFSLTDVSANTLGAASLHIPVLYARANLKQFSGGSSPTCTAWIAAK